MVSQLAPMQDNWSHHHKHNFLLQNIRATRAASLLPPTAAKQLAALVPLKSCKLLVDKYSILITTETCLCICIDNVIIDIHLILTE